jgi:hypothetical protein
VWHLAASSLFTGILFAFMMPAQQAIISDLVDQRTLLNAVSLNSVGMGLMGIFCASLAGVLIETVGVAGVYYTQALLYVLAVYTIVKLPLTGSANGSTASVWADLKDGIHYLRVSPALLVLLGLGLVRVLFVMPYRTLMPAFTRDVLGFDAADLGEPYAGATEAVKAAIVAAMREDYAGYNVTVLSSDDGPPPTNGAYATLHFGGYDTRLLGLADNVDQYNADRWQNAIIYVGSFADFSVMGLDAEEMGQMVGNVASHEFGHLLGLFHTSLPEDIMDTTGTAWDLAGDQSFLRGPLEQSVFPVGYENSPQRLAETVGVKPGAKKSDLSKNWNDPRMRRKLALRALVRDELRSRCGTCLHLDP